MEEIIDISVTYRRKLGERRKNKLRGYTYNPEWNKDPEPIPFRVIMLNHAKHTGKIYRGATGDRTLWQDSRFRMPLGLN